jgi:hypothetical protein
VSAYDRPAAVCPTCLVGTYDEGKAALYARIGELTRERDEALAEVARLRARVDELMYPRMYLPPGDERARALAALEQREAEEAPLLARKTRENGAS